MEVKFLVREESAFNFLKDRTLKKPNEGYGAGTDSPYSLIKDEMYFKKDKLDPLCIVDGDCIQIELSDQGSMSRKDLMNQYTYTAQDYDDVCIKMVLTDFKVIVWRLWE